MEPETVRRACDRLDEMQLFPRTKDEWVTPSTVEPWNEDRFVRKSTPERAKSGGDNFQPGVAKLLARGRKRLDTATAQGG